MKPEQQIAAEAAREWLLRLRQWQGFDLTEYQQASLIESFQAAIEKALNNQGDDYANMDAARNRILDLERDLAIAQRAAHASEAREWTVAVVKRSSKIGEREEIQSDQPFMADHDCIRVREVLPAHASEQGAVELATWFHETYERLAPNFGYETRKETRQFEPNTPNGRLMIAVCAELLSQRPTPATASEEADNKAMRIVSEQQRKPDSASAGTTQEQYNELARKTPREAKSPLSATPSGGGEWTVDGDFVCMEDGSSCLCANAYQAQAIADAHNQSLHPRDTVSENEWFDDSPAAKKPDSPLVENYLRMFVQDILHGDEDHRKWLLESVECFIEGKHIPERP